MINTGRRANQKKYHFKRYTKHERHVGIDTKNMRTMNMNMLLTYSLAYLLTSLPTYLLPYHVMCISLSQY